MQCDGEAACGVQCDGEAACGVQCDGACIDAHGESDTMVVLPHYG